MESPAPRRHPSLTRLRRFTDSLPETAEVEAWGHPTFRAGKKIFATWGADDGLPCIGVKQTLGQQARWIRQDGFFIPQYVGHHGWVSFYADEVPWDVAEAILEDSYRQVALKRMVKALDALRAR